MTITADATAHERTATTLAQLANDLASNAHQLAAEAEAVWVRHAGVSARAVAHAMLAAGLDTLRVATTADDGRWYLSPEPWDIPEAFPIDAEALLSGMRVTDFPPQGRTTNPDEDAVTLHAQVILDATEQD